MVEIGDIYSPTYNDTEEAGVYGRAAAEVAREAKLQDYPNYNNRYESWGHELNGLAQIAFCNLLGINYVLNPNAEAEPSTYMINGISVGIKYIDNPDHNLALWSKKQSYASAYVLMYHKPDNSFEYLGWAYKTDIQFSGWTSGDTWLLHKDNLRKGLPQ